MSINISIQLDTRRAKANGAYPVKLRVYSPSLVKAKFYKTGKSLTEQDFEKVWNSPKPRKGHKEHKTYLQKLESKANDVIKTISPFTFEQFEKKMFRKTTEGNNVFYHFVQKIDLLRGNEQISTANNYELSMKSFQAFCQSQNRKKAQTLSFQTVTPDWLQKYENYMVNDKGRSLTTVSMYTRTLRTTFNDAIRQKDIDQEFYPFGKGKYQPPAVKKVKKALTNDQLKAFYHAETETPEQQKAKDFWFFSYSCNGMNIKDIALLKYKDIQDDKIVFYRAKTKTTSKTNLKPITAYLSDFSRTIIENYSNPDKRPDKLVFSIIDPKSTAKEQLNQVKNFTRYINQHIKKLAPTIGLPSDISTYWARHSFATNAINKGASMEFVGEGLGHSNMKTTQGYFAGFEDDAKREMMTKLMDF